jgi:ryanodine receptor 2
MVEAMTDKLEIAECFSFGDMPKNVFCGPSTLLRNAEPFVPLPVDIAHIILPHFAMEIHQRLAENLHELWAMRKIELGWSYGDVINSNIYLIDMIIYLETK